MPRFKNLGGFLKRIVPLVQFLLANLDRSWHDVFVAHLLL
ncbi:hypothetical protein EV05_0049 [Prochlorococcus sp. MIT 0601]|nr:hypothetical protein EV05_0049 [Prochlorococcus sp. MIT 0601]